MKMMLSTTINELCKTVVVVLALLASASVEVTRAEPEVFWCDKLANEVQKEDEAVTTKTPPEIAGKWVSESCEVRPGPEFLLRSYTFHSNLTFRLLQFYYGDSSCSLPLYSVLATGRLRWARPSWLVQGAQEADYTLARVTVVAYSSELASALAGRVNASCPAAVGKAWRPHRPYVVYEGAKGGGGGGGGGHGVFSTGGELADPDADDHDCLLGLHLVFHELQLVRAERRPSPHRRHLAPGSTRSELLLGDIHTRLDQRAHYRPTSYQTPLLKTSETTGCYVCRVVSRADEHSPPHLHAVAHLPVHLIGEWMSRRCETKPLGTFVTRRVRFFGRKWQGVYRFHADPACANPSLNVIASGDFVARGASKTVHGGWDFDFRVTAVTLTPLDDNTVRSLNGHQDNSCGRNGSWQLGQPQDVTPTFGCAGLAIKVPSVHYELVRMSIDHHGNALLYLGATDSNFKRYSSERRPTAYQMPLMQCRPEPPRLSNHLDPIPNAIYSEPSSGAAAAAHHHHDAGRCNRSLSLLLLLLLTTLLAWV